MGTEKWERACWQEDEWQENEGNSLGSATNELSKAAWKAHTCLDSRELRMNLRRTFLPKSVSENSLAPRSSRGNEAQNCLANDTISRGDQSLVTSAATIFQTRSKSLTRAVFLAVAVSSFVSFKTAAAEVPVISGFSPLSAPVGASVSVSGTNFSANVASNVVYFGPVRGQVTAANATNLAVTVSAGAAYGPITVTVGGRSASAKTAFVPTFSGAGTPIDETSFGPRTDLAADSGPIIVVFADLDSDGKSDLVVANAYAHTISIYRNISTNGSLTAGAFAPRVVLPRGGGSDNPLQVVAADLDGDGKLDLVVPDRSANAVAIYRNLAAPGNIDSNSFAAPILLTVGNDPRYLSVGDLDGDDRPEIVTANYGASSLSILHNLSSPGALATNSFAPQLEIPAGPGAYGVVIGDLDGDGKPDLAVANNDAEFVSVFRNISTSGNIDTNSFEARVDYPALSGCGYIVLGDLDGDGKSELITGSYLGQTLSVFQNLSSPGTFDTGSFAARIDFAAGGRFHTVALGDINGDARPDLILVTEIPSHLSIFQNLSTPGTFTDSSLGSRVDFGSGYNAWGVAAGDLNGDGRPDVVLANSYDNTLSVYRNVVAAPPVFVFQPTNSSVTMGSNVTFAVAAIGAAPLSYQWLFNGAGIPEATNSTLTLSNVQFSNAGNYSVQVTNAFGSVTSSNAVLSVTAPPADARVLSTNAIAGASVTVPLLLVANGNENSFGFSLNFDPRVLAYAGASLGNGASGANFITNTSQTNNGRLGLALVLPAGSTLSAGTQQIALVSFTVALNIGQISSTTISFGDQPILRQLFDAQLNSLPATYSSGVISLAPATAFEGDVSPRPDGDGSYSLADWLIMGRYAARLDYPTNGSEFQRADCAPRSTLGDGAIKVTDWVQAGRYVFGLDMPTPLGGPTNEIAGSSAGPSASRLVTAGQATLTPGQSRSLSITLAAQGNENALAFSLSFDAARVSFSGAAPGNDAGGATLLVNSNEASSGRLGFVLALAAGNSFSPGTKELVRVSFVGSASASGAFSLALMDQPVPREVSDVAATALPASYVNGAIAINNAPALAIARSGQNIILSWPAWASNFTLQQTIGSLSPSGTWSNLSVSGTVSNNQTVVTLPNSGGAKFYRLSAP